MTQNKIFTCINGDKISFEELYKELYCRLRVAAFSVTKDEEEAKDITSDCFAKLLILERPFESIAHAQNYLQRMISNACINFIKRYRYAYEYRKKNGEPVDTKEFIEQQFDKSYIIQKVYEIIQQFPERQREAFILRHFKHKELDEIAFLMETSKSTVKNQLTDAMKRLRAELGDKEFLIFLWAIAPHFINN